MLCQHSVRTCPCCFKDEIRRLLPGAIEFEKDVNGRDTVVTADLETCIEAFLKATGIDVRHLVDDDTSESTE